jgi:hypothetical protein
MMDSMIDDALLICSFVERSKKPLFVLFHPRMTQTNKRVDFLLPYEREGSIENSNTLG